MSEKVTTTSLHFLLKSFFFQNFTKVKNKSSITLAVTLIETEFIHHMKAYYLFYSDINI